MSNNKSDFKGGMSPCQANIKVTGGINQITERGKLSWTIKDYEGKPHELAIPGIYYRPKCHITYIIRGRELSKELSAESHAK